MGLSFKVIFLKKKIKKKKSACKSREQCTGPTKNTGRAKMLDVAAIQTYT